MPDERARSHRYAEVKKPIGLSGAGRTAGFIWKPPLGASSLRARVAATAANGGDRGLDRETMRPYHFSAYS